MYGQVIDDRINELRLSNSDVAKALGADNGFVRYIRSDKRNSIRKDYFLKLMDYLGLNPLDFGGFGRLDLKSDKDFYNGMQIIEEINKLVNSHVVVVKDIALYMEVSLSLVYKLLNVERTAITIDNFAKLCNCFSWNYKDFLVDDNVIASPEIEKVNQEFIRGGIKNGDIKSRNKR